MHPELFVTFAKLIKEQEATILVMNISQTAGDLERMTAKLQDVNRRLDVFASIFAFVEDFALMGDQEISEMIDAKATFRMKAALARVLLKREARQSQRQQTRTERDRLNEDALNKIAQHMRDINALRTASNSYEIAEKLDQALSLVDDAVSAALK